MPPRHQQFLTRRELRALAKREMEDDLANRASELADRMQTREMREHQMKMQDYEMRQRIVAQAREDALMERKLAEDADEMQALEKLAKFDASIPDSHLAAQAILASHPAAMKSPVVKQLYAEAMKDAENTRQFAESYKASTGGMDLPRTPDGLKYDMTRAHMRLAQNTALLDARSKGMIDDDGLNNWKSMDEYEFGRVFPEWAANKTHEITRAQTLATQADERRKEVFDANIKLSDAAGDRAKSLREQMLTVTDPEAQKAIQASIAEAEAVSTQAFTKANVASNSQISMPGLPGNEETKKPSFSGSALKTREQIEQDLSQQPPTATP